MQHNNQITDERLNTIRQRYDLPALGALVIRDGKTVFANVVGVRKRGNPTPATLNDQFHLGSDTKAMTATLIALLVERTKLRWESTLGGIFGGAVPQMRSEYRDVTIEMLLAHRGGFSEKLPGGLIGWKMRQILTNSPRSQRKTLTRLALTETPAYSPGSQYVYSNTNYALLGAIAETVVGTDWEQMMRDEIFKPLGMTSAGYGAMGVPGTVLQPYPHREDGTPVAPGAFSDNPPAIAPAGTVHCSLGDWAKFVTAHLEGDRGSESLVTAATFHHLHTPRFGGTYAAGWIITERDWAKGEALTHSGSNTMNFATVWIAPKIDFAVLSVTNQGGEKAQKACDDVAAAAIGLR